MFEIRQRGSTAGTEILGGLTTFMAMSYILFVQPALLKKTDMDEGGVFMATCIASAAACFLMAFLANYPVALAPGMGENFFFIFTLCAVGAAPGVFRLTWQEALALTAAAGLIFLLLSKVGVRSYMLNAIPDSLKSGIAAGIGLFIALIGFEWGNIVTSDPNTCLTMAPLGGNYVAVLTVIGLAIILTLSALGVRGAILIGILATTLAAIVFDHCRLVSLASQSDFNRLVGVPHGLDQTAGAMVGGFEGLAQKLFAPESCMHVLTMGFIVLFMVMFDTVGTLVGVAKRAGLMTGSTLPKAEQALASDAGGTLIGACLGTSTVTSYIESITGVASGARTGLATVVTGICLLLALFFQPLAQVVGGGVKIGVSAFGDPILRYPMIAPALIFVGALMMRVLKEVNWDDATETIPSFLAMVSMPFTYNIAHGVAFGFISYAFLKLVSGRPKQCPIIVYVFAALFVLQFILS
ncbi:MAG: NCS2 family permease [Planctomycetes bacterium]|nr:NCS2 family permease [Planctomycetota bacterium]